MVLEKIVSESSNIKNSLCHLAQYALLGSTLLIGGALGCADPLPLSDYTLENENDFSNQIAYFVSDSNSAELVIADEEGTEIQRFDFPWKVNAYVAPCWTADGRKIVVLPENWPNGGVFTIDIYSGKLEALVQSAGVDYSHPKGAPNGDFAVQTSEVQNKEFVEIAVVHGTTLERVTHNHVQDYSPAWTADERLLYVSGNTHRSTVYSYDGEQHTQVQTGLPYIYNIAPSPDGSLLAILGGAFEETSLHQVPVTGGVAEVLAPINGRNLQWAPDGRYIVFDTGVNSLTHSLYRWDITEKQLVRLAAEGNGSPAVSRDSEYIVFRSNRTGDPNLFKMRWDGTEIQPLTSQVEPFWVSPAEWEGYCR